MNDFASLGMAGETSPELGRRDAATVDLLTNRIVDIGPRLEECLKTTHAALGGDVLHVEYESRDGRPT